MEQQAQRIEDILDEEVIHEEVQKNVNINEDDFGDDETIEEEEEEQEADESDTDDDEEEEEQEEESDDDDEEEEEDRQQLPPNTKKQQAAAGIVKKRAGMAFTMYNFAAKRAGKMFTPTKPDHFKIIGEDKEDLQEMLECTAEEENWTGVKSKWFLIAGFLLLIVERVMTIKKPLEETQAKSLPGADISAVDKKLAAMEKLIEQLQEQNNLYKMMLNERKEGELKKETSIQEQEEKRRYYKGYDLRKISFTKNGQIKDPSKAGMRGYTGDGTKVGAISDEIKDIKEKFDLYQEFVLKHNIGIEEAEEIFE